MPHDMGRARSYVIVSPRGAASSFRRVFPPSTIPFFRFAVSNGRSGSPFWFALLVRPSGSPSRFALYSFALPVRRLRFAFSACGPDHLDCRPFGPTFLGSLIPREADIMRERLSLSLLVAALITGCHGTTAPPPAERVPAGDWPSYGRTVAGDRFSPLTQIDRTNVARLGQVCAYVLPDVAALQTGPIVVDGTMYFTTDTVSYAIDSGATCRGEVARRAARAAGGRASRDSPGSTDASFAGPWTVTWWRSPPRTGERSGIRRSM